MLRCYTSCRVCVVHNNSVLTWLLYNNCIRVSFRVYSCNTNRWKMKSHNACIYTCCYTETFTIYLANVTCSVVHNVISAAWLDEVCYRGDGPFTRETCSLLRLMYKSNSFRCEELSLVRCGWTALPTLECSATRQNTLALRTLLSLWQ